jgi:hypothetical protein
LTHTVEILWKSDQPVAEASTYTRQHNIETQDTNFHVVSGIQTRDPSNQAAADLRLRLRGYRSRCVENTNVEKRDRIVKVNMDSREADAESYNTK